MTDLAERALTLAVESVGKDYPVADIRKRAWEYLVFLKEAELDYKNVIEQQVREGVEYRSARYYEEQPHSKAAIGVFDPLTGRMKMVCGE